MTINAIDHPARYYAQNATLPGAEAGAGARPALDRTIDVETCVVGAGFAGLTTALGLAGAGRSVALLEAQCVGWGASGRNGGFVSPGFAQSLAALEARLGRDHTRELFCLSRAGVDFVRATMDQPACAAKITGQGWVNVVRHEAGAALRQRRDQAASAYGINYTYWDTEQTRARLKSKRYFQGLFEPSAFHINPLDYARSLAGLAEQSGAKIFEATPATSLARSATGWRVATPTGVVNAGHVVLAGSAYMSGLWPKLERAVLPVATYVVTTEKLGDRLGRAVDFGGCISDTRRAGDYYRVVDGDRLLWGGRITTQRAQPGDLAAKIKSDIAAVYPQLGDFEIETAWSGLMGYALHKMPLIGALERGLWVATAFGGHGLNTTAMAGNLIAAAISTGDDQWRLFAPFTARWGGGVIGRAGTQVAYWAMQARDWIDENRGGK
ncbi:MAG: NAD(P)/FAD-dependent oxidoreductase [Alphaproteobacteria bacterium]